jgi:hypothetical protein
MGLSKLVSDVGGKVLFRHLKKFVTAKTAVETRRTDIPYAGFHGSFAVTNYFSRPHFLTLSQGSIGTGP